jgi:hypothetical protein
MSTPDDWDGLGEVFLVLPDDDLTDRDADIFGPK